MANEYLITFTPYERFYFGSTQSFGEGFYAKSLLFPTQTTILGALRKTILEKKNMLDNNNRYPRKDSGYEKYTGTSRASGLNEKDCNLGIINKISPVFIVEGSTEKTTKILFPLPSDVHYGKTGLVQIDFPEREQVLNSRGGNNSHQKELTFGKSYPTEYFGDCYDWSSYIERKQIKYNPVYEINKIIQSATQPGIARKDRNKIDGQFYVKNDYLMKRGYSFGVIVEINNIDCKEIFQKDLVILGGEQSKFKLENVEVNDEIKKLSLPMLQRFYNSYNPESEVFEVTNQRIVFLSDSLGGWNNNDVSHSIIPGTEVFRSLNTKGYKTNSFSLIPGGSVVNFNKQSTIINTQKFSTKIGYNYFIEA